eukprot:2550020-Rhodomonas_salina.1
MLSQLRVSIPCRTYQSTSDDHLYTIQDAAHNALALRRRTHPVASSAQPSETLNAALAPFLAGSRALLHVQHRMELSAPRRQVNPQPAYHDPCAVTFVLLFCCHSFVVF